MKQLPQVLAQKERPHLIILHLRAAGGRRICRVERLARVSGAVGNPGDCAYGSRPRGQRKTSLESGAIAFFQKPADNDELLGVIRASLQAGMGRRLAIVAVPIPGGRGRGSRALCTPTTGDVGAIPGLQRPPARTALCFERRRRVAAVFALWTVRHTGRQP